MEPVSDTTTEATTITEVFAANTTEVVAADGAVGAYAEALAGGRNAGFLRNYANRPDAEIERAIASIEKQIAEHQAKIANPSAFIEDWSRLDPREQQALLNSK